MDNLLNIAAPPSPEEGDSKANPPAGGQGAGAPPSALGLGLPPASASPMMQHFGDREEAARLHLAQMKEAKRLADACRKELDQLVALGDTVTMDDVVKAAAGMVAAGTPAVKMAGVLAEAPEGSEALRAWVAQQDAQAQGVEKQVNAGLAQAGYNLGNSALKSILAHSAEQHVVRQASATRRTLH